jgi:hypothetical protein
LTRYDSTVRRTAVVVAVLAAAGTVVTGCKRTPVAIGTAGDSGMPTASPSTGASGTGGSGTGGGGSGSGSSMGSGGFADFPVGVGNTWVYRSVIGRKSHGTVTNKMTKVVPVSGGKRVTMEVTDHISGVPTAPTQLTYIFHANGSITVPLAQVSTSKVRLVSGNVVWPDTAQLASGKPYRTKLILAASEGGKVTRLTSHVTVRGGGTQTVKVPAGTYHAQVIDEIVTEKVGGLKVTVRLRTWVARGVGPVKSALLSNSALPTSVQVLKSFHKG